MKVPVTELREGMQLINGHTVVAVIDSVDAVVVETRDLNGDMHETLEAPSAVYEVFDNERVIDLTPTWTALVLPMAQVYCNPEAPVESRKVAEESLLRVARLADYYAGAVRAAGGGDDLFPDQKES